MLVDGKPLSRVFDTPEEGDAWIAEVRQSATGGDMEAREFLRVATVGVDLLAALENVMRTAFEASDAHAFVTTWPCRTADGWVASAHLRSHADNRIAGRKVTATFGAVDHPTRPANVLVVRRLAAEAEKHLFAWYRRKALGLRGGWRSR